MLRKGLYDILIFQVLFESMVFIKHVQVHSFIKSKGLWIFLLGIVICICVYIIVHLTLLTQPVTQEKKDIKPAVLASENQTPTSVPTHTITPTITPTPTHAPLSFAELNTRYGPCVYSPTLMYHHIEDLGGAKLEGHAQLTVGIDYFRKQMEYLKTRGYTTITMQDLINFFDQGTALPTKPILLTFDDGYSDFTSAASILHTLGLQGALFLPTGLVNNPGYLTWNNIKDIAGFGNIYFANHTWSHHSVAASKDIVEKEILLADTQLHDHGFNSAKVFAYPYGNTSANAIQVLNSLNYKLAFTTRQASILCKQQRLELPRLRIGNAQLNAYGL